MLFNFNFQDISNIHRAGAQSHQRWLRRGGQVPRGAVAGGEAKHQRVAEVPVRRGGQRARGVRGGAPADGEDARREAPAGGAAAGRAGVLLPPPARCAAGAL